MYINISLSTKQKQIGLHQIKKALYGSEITDGRNTYRMGENT
jgi:hypothetical protein